MPTAQLPAHISGKLRNVAGLVFDDSGAATYSTLTAAQTTLLALYGATVGGAVVQNPINPSATALFPAALVLVGVNTTGLTSAQIDSTVFPTTAPIQATDGVVIHDATNHLLLVRQGGKWYKSAAFTLIA